MQRSFSAIHDETTRQRSVASEPEQLASPWGRKLTTGRPTEQQGGSLLHEQQFSRPANPLRLRHWLHQFGGARPGLASHESVLTAENVSAVV